jgi:hypothetical protein
MFQLIVYAIIHEFESLPLCLHTFIAQHTHTPRTPHTPALTHPHTRTHSHTHSLSLNLFLSLPHTYTLPLSLPHTHTHTNTHTHTHHRTALRRYSSALLSMLVITLVTPMSAVAFTMDALMGPLHVETMNSVLWLSLLILMVGTLYLI